MLFRVSTLWGAYHICMDAGGLFLLNFLFQIPEQLRIEKVLDCDSQTISEFLDCRNCCAAVPTADDVVYCGLGHTAHATELVDGNIALAAQFQNALFNSFADVHGYHLSSLMMIPASS